MQFLSPDWRKQLLAVAALAAMAPLGEAQTSASAATPANVASPVPAPASTSSANGTPEESSYSLGLVFGNQLHSAGIGQELSLEAVMRGLKDGLDGKVMSSDDRQRAMQSIKAGRDRMAEQNHEVAKAFLAKNKDAPRITTTDSGLQYEIIAPGDAKSASPTLSDRVTVHYRGRLLDGTEFDNSDNHAQAASFNVNAVIKGWREAMLLMKPGAKWRLFVPPELAYDMNSPPSIPPGSLLVFDMELVRIEPPPVMNAPAAKSPKAPKDAKTSVKPAPKPAATQ